MKVFVTVALALVVLVGTARSQKSIREVACVEYRNGDYPDWRWEPNASLEDVPHPRSFLDKSYVVKVERSGDGIHLRGDLGGTSYTYTVSAGVLGSALWGSKQTLFAEVERAFGKGESQLFRIDFMSFKSIKLVEKSYIVWPNQKCTTISPFNAKDIGGINVYSRYKISDHSTGWPS